MFGYGVVDGELGIAPFEFVVFLLVAIEENRLNYLAGRICGEKESFFFGFL